MPAVYQSYSSAALRVMFAQIAADLNAGAIGHVRHSQNEVPIDKGNLHDSIRVTDEATAGSLRAVVEAGGIEVRGVNVNYAEEVEMGQNAQPYFVPGMDVGRQIILDRGRNGGR